MLTVLNWVPRGKANPQPEVMKYEEEPQQESMKVESQKNNKSSASAGNNEEEDINKIYNLDNYDDEGNYLESSNYDWEQLEAFSYFHIPNRF